MTRWTLFLDESGRFEGAAMLDPKGRSRGEERVGLVLGGVLSPGHAESLDEKWNEPFRAACKKEGCGYPPHANRTQRQVELRLRERASELVSASNGWWLFVVDKPNQEPPAERVQIFPRMLAEVVDLAARFCAGHEPRAQELDVLPATRGGPLDQDHSNAVKTLGVGSESVLKEENEPSEQKRTFTHFYPQYEVRTALNALARQACGLLGPWPKLNAVRPQAAKEAKAATGIFLADFGCHATYTHLKDSAPNPLAAWRESLGSDRSLVVERSTLRRVLAVDNHLRSGDVASAGEEVAFLDGHARGELGSESPYRLAREGAADVARRLWSRGCEGLEAVVADTAEALALARKLAETSEVRLKLKTGDYAGVWLALEEFWVGSGKLAMRLKDVVQRDDRELAARLWAIAVECANHRGDVIMAATAANAFEGSVDAATFPTLLRMRSLNTVTLQNKLPATVAEVNSILMRLDSEAGRLYGVADSVATPLAVLVGGPRTHPETAPSDAEAALWSAARHGSPHWQRLEVPRGEAYGTVARSYAFLGKLDLARDVAFNARSFFPGSAFHLGYNTTVLARIELERARLGSGADLGLIYAALALPPLAHAREPINALAEMRKTLAARFAIDVVLRALLWTGDTVLAIERPLWLDALRADELYAVLSDGGCRDHPTELISRHAAELLRREGEDEAARRWFALSMAVCDESPEGTLKAFGRFTNRLATAPDTLPEGPPSSIFNPTFEYR